MSSDPGLSPCDTGPLELRLEVIGPGTLAGRGGATRSPELVQRLGNRMCVPTVSLFPWKLG